MYKELLSQKKKIAVIGLGYVGLPIALEFAKDFNVIGFDINQARVDMMKKGQDPSNELAKEVFQHKNILFTANLDDVREASFFIVAVPTDINQNKVPNLTPLMKASETVGKVLSKGDIVVYESTVYPGCTEEDCLPILEKVSGLKLGNFQLGYSPERIVPGDKVRTLTTILKVVSGSNEATLDTVAQVYGHIIEAGVYRAPSIKVAEAAKVIENTQRDLNISLMNELSIIFDKMEIDTQEVIKAAGTKWNFLKFYPGLVGGHCISVDPYYLLHKARELGVDPQVIASGRRINDAMPAYVAKRLVQMLIQFGKSPKDCKVLVKGITFKENVSDIRNSKVADLIKELIDFSIDVHVIDPYASPDEVAHEYGISMVEKASDNYDAIIVAVAHKEYRNLEISYFKSIMNNNPILFDLKAVFPKNAEGVSIWRL